MRKYDMVLFDFDGTLMNTYEGIVYSGKKAMEFAGLPIPANTNWNVFIGPPLDDCFRFTFGIQDKDLLNKLCKKYDEVYVAEGCLMCSFYPGMLDLLKKLKEMGCIVGVVSMKYTSLLSKISRYFGIDKVIDCMEGQALGSTTTKDQLIRNLCAKYKVDVAKCLMVGDSNYDYQGAMNAGCDAVKVNWGFGFAKDEPGAVASAGEILKKVEEDQ